MPVMVLLPLLAACPNPVDPKTPDSTPPDATLDAFGIPIQPGASSQPNPESINVTCCDVARAVSPGVIDLVTAGADLQSGIESVSIWVTNETTICEHADGTATRGGPGSAGSVAKNPATPIPTPPATAPDRLLVSYSFKIAPRPSGCVSYRASWDVYSEASNYAGLSARTKRFHLHYSAP
jgi:hypothetical protein